MFLQVGGVLRGTVLQLEQGSKSREVIILLYLVLDLWVWFLAPQNHTGAGAVVPLKEKPPWIDPGFRSLHQQLP